MRRSADICVQGGGDYVEGNMLQKTFVLFPLLKPYFLLFVSSSF